MNTINAASCCCNQTPGPFDPCAPPTTGSAVRLTWQSQAADRARKVSTTCGSCYPCDPEPCAAEQLNAEPSIGACVFDLTATLNGDLACSYATLRYDGSATQTMSQAWVAVLPWVSTSNGVGVRQWYTPGGMLTDFFASSVQRAHLYQGTVAGTRRIIYGDHQYCSEIVTDPTCLQTASATFTQWPSYTSGPTVFRIRRATSTSTARIWEVVARTFQIKNASNVVVWSTPLAGKTFAQLLAAVNAQTTARVTMTWATTATPNAFSQGLSAETYFADQSYTTTNIPTSTQTPSDIRMFTLTNEQPLPDPQPGQCSTAVGSVGWSTTIGSAVLWSTIAVDRTYGRGACSRALADEMCAGVGFAGQNNFYNPTNTPLGDILAAGGGLYALCSNNPNLIYDFDVEGQCCESVFSLAPASPCYSGPIPQSYCMTDVSDPLGRLVLGSPSMYRSCPVAQAAPYEAWAIVEDIEIVGTPNIDFSPCCPSGVECAAGYERRVWARKVSEWAKVERIA